jgi:hypothetical protein
VKPILLNSAPLSLLLPLAVVAAIRKRPAATTGASDAAGNGASRTERARFTVRLCAIFWIVTVVFFTIAAYKRRAYILPLWPACALMLAWWVNDLGARFGRVIRPAFGALCLALIVFNFVFIPRREIKECGGDSYRGAAVEITRAVGRDEPLYLYGFEGDVAPLLFYLDRNAPPLRGKLGDAPPGYVLVPEAVWTRLSGEAPGLEPILTARSGNRAIVLLRRGKLYATVRGALHELAGRDARPTSRFPAPSE